MLRRGAGKEGVQAAYGHETCTYEARHSQAVGEGRE
jgi:hypothetical protein